ncbi:MAG: hypothetical protein CO090_08650 [Acidobacteria bacterium CG_4_9_14_3_um_filter_49_7]|nr:MAG: hypothetical protein CO090_08650 [Acidobacteria bacterium CG_4_9_14_3_um_filter_49_7]
MSAHDRDPGGFEVKRFGWVLMVLALIPGAFAQDIDFAGPMNQVQFSNFTKEMGTALWFSPGAPAESLGVTGFDVSADILLVNISNGSDFWKNMTIGDPNNFLTTTRIHVQKGLPFGVDVGMMWSKARDSNVSSWGVEAKYSLVKGSTVMPAVVARASYSKLTGVDHLNMNTKSLGLMVSKGFLMFTPYAGVSLVQMHASPSVAGTGLSGVTESVTQVSGGLQFSPFPFLVVNGEVSKGEVLQYALKVGIRF